jgi:hemolysin III
MSHEVKARAPALGHQQPDSPGGCGAGGGLAVERPPISGHELLVPRLRGVSHAIAFGVSIVAAVAVVVLAPAGRASVAAAIYGVSLVALFGGSALYHRWRGPDRFKPMLRRVDHSTIFVFIAASYTPIALGVLHGPLRWVVLGLGWLGAVAGIAFSMGWIEAPRTVVATSYLTLGWLAVIAAPELISDLPLTPLILVCAGGMLYSAGAIVYARRRPNPWPRTFGFHEIFHALVILGTATYYVAVLGWMLPAAGG